MEEMLIMTIRRMSGMLLLGLCGMFGALRLGAYDFAPAERLVQQWVDKGYCPGAGIWIVDKQGNTIYEKWWNRYDRNTDLMIASATKWLEAAVIASLVDEGVLKLDDPVRKHLPELSGPAGDNTIRQMLSHTSSIGSMEVPESCGSMQLPGRVNAAAERWRPGEKFQYTGLALALLARMVEEKSDQPYLFTFARKIAVPCEMRRTVTGSDLWTYQGMVGSSIFPTSNAADYMNFLLMLLNEGKFRGKTVLSPEMVEALCADQLGGAEVDPDNYIRQATGFTHHGVYGLGNWRVVVDADNRALLLASNSFAGFAPWIDRKHGVAGILVMRADSAEFNAFLAAGKFEKLIWDIFEREP